MTDRPVIEQLDFSALKQGESGCCFGVLCPEQAIATLQMRLGPVPACVECCALFLGFGGYHEIDGVPSRTWLREKAAWIRGEN